MNKLAPIIIRKSCWIIPKNFGILMMMQKKLKFQFWLIAKALVTCLIATTFIVQKADWRSDILRNIINNNNNLIIIIITTVVTDNSKIYHDLYVGFGWYKRIAKINDAVIVSIAIQRQCDLSVQRNLILKVKLQVEIRKAKEVSKR